MMLIHGDCLHEMDRLISKGIKVDLTVTSPPYDNLRTYNDSLEWGEHVWKPIIEKLFTITKEGGVVVWVVGDATIKGSETGTSFKQALYFKECGFNLHDTMIYQTDKPPSGNNRYMQNFEYMFIFSKGSPKSINLIKVPCIKANSKTTMYAGQRGKNGEYEKKEKRMTGATRPKKNIWNIYSGRGAGDKLSEKHPAKFPEQLANDHIISWSNEGDTVLDPFMGSGTTGKMSKINNRNFIGIEKDETYFDITKERIK